MNIIDQILKEANHINPPSLIYQKKVPVKMNESKKVIVKEEVKKHEPVKENESKKVIVKEEVKKHEPSKDNVAVVINELVDRIKVVEEDLKKIKTESTVHKPTALPSYNFTIKRDSNGKIESVVASSVNK